MREYYFLTGLDESPYQLTLLDALHLGSTGHLNAYITLQPELKAVDLDTGEPMGADVRYLEIERGTVQEMEKQAERSRHQEGENPAPQAAEVQRRHVIQAGEVGTAWDWSLIARAELYSTHETRAVRLSDLLFWANDLDKLADAGRIQRRANDTASATQAPDDSQTAAATPEDEPEIKRLQRTVAALALGLMKKHGNTYCHQGEPNASQLAKLATEHLRDATSDRTPPGYSETTVRQTIAAALKACPEAKG
jgi:hypothetical protein